MRGASPTSVESRYRHSSSFNKTMLDENGSKMSWHSEEDTSKYRSLRSRVWKYGERSLYDSSLDRILSCKFPTLKLVVFIIVIGAFFTLFRSPSVHETHHISSSRSRSSLIDRWIRDKFDIDSSYSSHLNINWDDISAAIKRLTDSGDYKGIGLLNLNEQETNEFKQLLPDAEHVTLAMNYASRNVTWETLYPEYWLDEEEEFEVPICPNLPKIHFSGKPRLDLIVVKLPCDKSKNWYRDVARLHLQLEAARLAGTTKGFRLEIRYSGNPKREAYATILHSAHVYVCGAIAAAQSIRMAGSTRDLVILVDETITDYHRSGLEQADAYNEWNDSKFRLWQLTDYDKIIFIDADLLVLRNIDFLFQMPEISATGNEATLFNSGVMLIEPSNCTFQLLMDHINEIESYNGGDQGYLNEIFTWWHRIPKHMNFLKHFWVGDEEEKERLKPWLCFRDYDCNWNVDILQEFASDVAHASWWKVHDAMPENLQKYCLLRSKQKAALGWDRRQEEKKAALGWDRRQAEKANYSDAHWKIKIQDKRLSTCFKEFCFWESMLWHWGDKNWTDNATIITTLPPPSIKAHSLSSSL
ncbi:hypothetical protein CASFOL_034818 [Castilleja foliolosa]|uniref:Hexosyltransferase n=1 Tax=Castilleja foliolosa TaxID=1961234 RepID=A0ABD3BS39_9LAMI